MNISMHEALDAFYASLYAQNESVIKLGLDPIRRAFELQQLYPTTPNILIAGTNGKGQVSATLSNICTTAKLKTGLFTSPHLVEFCERIRINGEIIPNNELLKLGLQTLARFAGRTIPEICQQLAAEYNIQIPKRSGIILTFFELVLIIAQTYFQKNNIDFGIYEVGLGGRLDATNVIQPSLSIITSIGYDHMQYLGNTPEKICYEKAGILRPYTPAILGSTHQSILLKLANERACSPIECLGCEFSWIEKHNTVYFVRKNQYFPMLGAENFSNYQRDNAAIAFAAAQILQEQNLLPTNNLTKILESILLHTRWVGRMWSLPPKYAQKFGCKNIIMDGAHNIDGVNALCSSIESTHPESPIAFVVNSCADKAVEDMFARYKKLLPNEAFFIAPSTNIRLLTPNAYCERVGLPQTQASTSIQEALTRAAQYVGSEGIVFITGSLYLLGDVLKELQISASTESILF